MGKKSKKASTSSGKNAKKSSGTGRCNPKQPNDEKGEKRKYEEVKLRDPEEEVDETELEIDVKKPNQEIQAIKEDLGSIANPECPLEPLFGFGLDWDSEDDEYFFGSGPSASRVVFCRSPYKEGEVVHPLHMIRPGKSAI